MSGIFCQIWQKETGKPNGNTIHKLCSRRGNNYKCYERKLSHNWSSYLSCSGLYPKSHDSMYYTDNVNFLLWNGTIYHRFLVSLNTPTSSILCNHLIKSKDVPGTLASIQGNYSLIYYQEGESKLWFAKDYMGRSSLIMKLNPDRDNLILSSAMDKTFESAIEVPAVGIFVFDLATSTLSVYPWGLPDENFKQKVNDLNTILGLEVVVLKSVFQRKRDSSNLNLEPEPQNITYYGEILFSATSDEDSDISESQISDIKENLDNVDMTEENPENSITPMEKRGNKSPKTLDFEKTALKCLHLEERSNNMDREKMGHVMNNLLKRPEIRQTVQRVINLLKKSVQRRVENKLSICQSCTPNSSGYYTVCKHVKLGILFSGGVDSTILAALVNEFVPLDQAIDLINVAFENSSETSTADTVKNSTFWGTNFDSPDRKTSMQAIVELQEAYPKRQWNAVECNIRQIQIEAHRRNTIDDLVYPDSTVSGSSLGCALWFASEGVGIVSANQTPYQTTAKILLLGIGADELFGGYARHRTTLRTQGWSALTKELNAELMNISEMNLGIVDRVVSDHKKQPEFPYLDDKLVEYVRSLNAWERCFPMETMPEGLGDKLLLRLVARELGLHKTATVPQRSIELGSGMPNIIPNSA